MKKYQSPKLFQHQPFFTCSLIFLSCKIRSEGFDFYTYFEKRFLQVVYYHSLSAEYTTMNRFSFSYDNCENFWTPHIPENSYLPKWICIIKAHSTALFCIRGNFSRKSTILILCLPRFMQKSKLLEKFTPICACGVSTSYTRTVRKLELNFQPFSSHV